MGFSSLSFVLLMAGILLAAFFIIGMVLSRLYKRGV